MNFHCPERDSPQTQGMADWNELERRLAPLDRRLKLAKALKMMKSSPTLTGWAAIAVILAAMLLATGSEAAPRQQTAMMCFKTGEQTSGTNRICYYNCLGSTVAITVPFLEFCPLSIKR